MLIAIYHILKGKIPFHDLGTNYFDSFCWEHKARNYLRRLLDLGWVPVTSPTITRDIPIRAARHALLQRVAFAVP